LLLTNFLSKKKFLTEPFFRPQKVQGLEQRKKSLEKKKRVDNFFGKRTSSKAVMFLLKTALFPHPSVVLPER
jgi:hypothetical protein